MPSEFQTMCAAARGTIPVPEFPVGAIRDAAKGMAIPTKPRKRIVAIALSGLLLAGAAGAAELWQKAHVSFGPSGSVGMSTDEFHPMRNPTADDLRTIAEHATF
ncbi:MAG: hypothetical protein JOZ01_01095, partial [Candidatus Eremiobacteraeota bacterium]|nr:hypothetical protein [Candidatus Eremiobacteraeota bacterium]